MIRSQTPYTNHNSTTAAPSPRLRHIRTTNRHTPTTQAHYTKQTNPRNPLTHRLNERNTVNDNYTLMRMGTTSQTEENIFQ